MTRDAASFEPSSHRPTCDPLSRNWSWCKWTGRLGLLANANTHDIGEVFRNLVDDLIPKYHSIPHRVGLGDIRQELSASGLSELERIGSDPLDADTGEDGDL